MADISVMMRSVTFWRSLVLPLSSLLASGVIVAAATRRLPFSDPSPALLSGLIATALLTGVLLMFLRRLAQALPVCDPSLRRLIIGLIAGGAIMAFFSVSMPRLLAWQWGAGPQTGAPAPLLYGSSWDNVDRIFIYLHATYDPSATPYGVWRATASLDEAAGVQPAQAELWLTQPSWAVIDATTGRPPSNIDGVDVAIGVQRGQELLLERRIALDPPATAEQGRWRRITLDLPPGAERLIVEVHPRGLLDHDFVWVTRAVVSPVWSVVIVDCAAWVLLIALGASTLAFAGRIPPVISRCVLNGWVTVVFICVLYLLAEPRWLINDDVAMSMIAHGYGIAAFGSPNLVYSNVVWGYLVRVIPTIDGVLGYSIANIIVLVFSGIVILYALQEAGYGWPISLSVMVILLIIPVLYLHFSFNSGLLTIGAVVLWHIYGRQRSKLTLLIGCLLAFFGYLIRWEMFLFILLIALPMLPWVKLITDRTALVAALTLSLAIGAAAFVDYQAYQGDDWQKFKKLNSARLPFTDYVAGFVLRQHPEILARYGYSNKDISLIETFFFEDTKTADSDSLSAMLAEIRRPLLLNAAWDVIKALPGRYHFLTALFLLLLLPNPRILVMWVLFLFAAGVIGALGRYATRIYLPVTCLLVIAPLLIESRRKGKFRFTLVFFVILLSVYFQIIGAPLSKELREYRDFLWSYDQNFAKEPIVIWGAEFPYEIFYPVLRTPDSFMSHKIYGLNVFSHAPFSISHIERKSGNGMIKRLTSRGVRIVLSDEHLGMLAEYCKERFGGVLSIEKDEPYRTRFGVRLRCELVTDR